MKRMVAGLISVLLLAVAAVPVEAQEELGIDELMERVLRANGGEEGRRMLANTTIAFEGTLYLEENDDVTGTWVNYLAPGNKMYYETSFMNQNMRMKSDGTTTWSATFDDEGNVVKYSELEGQWADMGSKMGDINMMFLDFEKNGINLEKLPDETIDGQHYHVVKYTFDDVDNLSMTVYFDSESYLPHLQQWSYGPPFILYDFRDVHGIPFPYKRAQDLPPGRVVMDTDSIVLGKEMEESLFTP